MQGALRSEGYRRLIDRFAGDHLLNQRADASDDRFDQGFSLFDGCHFRRLVVDVIGVYSIIDYLWPLWDDHKQRVSDKLFKTWELLPWNNEPNK